jgi:DNA-binding protein H-NS
MSKSYKELQAEIARLQQEAYAVRRSELAVVVAEIKAKMAEYGLTVADLGGGATSKLRGSTVAPKYRNTATGQTWSGRGKHPRWLTEAIAAGKTLESFLIV